MSAIVAGWWLVAIAIVVTILSAPAASSPRQACGGDGVYATRIVQQGLKGWPIPVERAAFDAYHRGFRESDEQAIERAVKASDWLQVWPGLAVHVLLEDGAAVQVCLLEGDRAGALGWVQARHLERRP